MAPAYLTARRFVAVNAVLLGMLLGSIVLASLIGSVHVDLARALQPGMASNTDRVILFETRLPRVLLAAVVGGALATAGVALQGLLRNPLAEPHLIGVSGGAALGAVVAVILGGRTVLTETSLLPLAAALGALLSMAIIYRLALVHGRLQPYVLLLAGVVYNAFAGALILCVNAIADFYQAQGILFWLMGNLATQSYALVLTIGLYTVAGTVWLLLHTRQLNVLSLGDEGALQLGVAVDRTRRATFFGASLLVGAVVSVSGMIGFVGLIVPHVMRLILGADHRLLLPASLLGGATFLIWADTVARTALGVVEIPVGVVTALCGGPFFVYLLKREGRKAFGV
ncbi:MAG TPA: iron ABC transporter permease [Candidatus Margulisiibacteriota bacterium]|nr:iron ABC transporter permease [Candidatus Margulisiibacteriota bacterium]